MGYANGAIPASVLTKTASGTNGDGYWEHLWTPGTLARWNALVADVLEHEGVRLYVTAGWNVFRPLAAQRIAKQKYGSGAAAVGFSSHGGFYRGLECMAIDVANWAQIGKANFFSYARKHGFVVNEFESEPWHIIDYSPWALRAGGGGNTFEEDFMSALTDQQQRDIHEWLRQLAYGGMPGGIRDIQRRLLVEGFSFDHLPAMHTKLDLQTKLIEQLAAGQGVTINLTDEFAALEKSLSESFGDTLRRELELQEMSFRGALVEALAERGEEDVNAAVEATLARARLILAPEQTG